MAAQLTFDAFDVDHQGELSVFVNSKLVASVPDVDRTDWDEIWVPLLFDVSSFVSKSNEVLFTLGVPRRACSIKNVKLLVDSKTVIDDIKTYTISDESPSLVLGAPRTTLQGNFTLPAIIIGGIAAVAVLYFLFRRK